MKDIAALAVEMGDSCPALRVRAAGRMLARLYDEALREVGLEMSQLPLLAAVATRGDRGFNVTDLARVLVMDRTSVTRAIKPLEQTGLLRVARSPNDARLKIVVITRAGESRFREAYPRWRRKTRRIREVFGDARVDALIAELSALVDAGPRLGPSSK
jgi:DNA-binding MarR family transcriptional regulator